ncbi:transcriptional repressor [Actinopolymorpha pittospori]|uniref:Fe2+ or Zn2+ uptake regulation protein n=1 Tax=Actinopolymorpha pittospori TaxID=648752 RepID=A0A927RFP2_9ACTN|nr:Fe2+ or Zn2+ uptake regulation protein [Actinopolymorpha pittospori]
MRAADRTADELRAAGLAPTMQRRVVLAAMEGRQRPVSALEVHRHLRTQGYAVGLTTVYRTLHALADAGVAHSFTRDGEQTYRHCRYGPHHHLVCEVCGLVIERPVRNTAAWMEQIGAEEDFVPNPQHSDLLGVCGACRRGDPCHHQVGGDHHNSQATGALSNEGEAPTMTDRPPGPVPLTARTRPDLMHTAALKETVRDALDLGLDHTVVIQQLACAEPDCPPIETVVAVLSPTEPPRRWTLHQPLSAVTADDIRTIIRTTVPQGEHQ